MVLRCGPAETRTLHVDLRWSGEGQVLVTPGNHTCEQSCELEHNVGSTVTLTAQPLPGAEFVGWSGDCAGAQPTTTVQMSANRTCTAEFRSTATYWLKSYGSDGYEDHVAGVADRSDGGYNVLGSFENDWWLVALDASGNITGQLTLGGNNTDFVWALTPAPGGFYATGSSQSFGAGSSDFLIARLDENGGVQWANSYGTSKFEGFSASIATADGGLTVVGEGDFYDPVNEYYRDWMTIFRLSPDGAVQWQRVYGMGSTNSLGAVAKTSDDGMILVCGVYLSSVKHTWILKLDAQGDRQWERLVEGTGSFVTADVHVRPDDGFLVVGTLIVGYDSPDISGMALSFGPGGDLEWQRAYRDQSNRWFRAVVGGSAGGYLVSGSSLIPGTATSAGWVLELDAQGTPQWERLFLGGIESHFDRLRRDVNDNVILTGRLHPAPEQASDILILKWPGDSAIVPGCDPSIWQVHTTPSSSPGMTVSDVTSSTLSDSYTANAVSLSVSLTTAGSTTWCAF